MEAYIDMIEFMLFVTQNIFFKFIELELLH